MAKTGMVKTGHTSTELERVTVRVAAGVEATSVELHCTEMELGPSTSSVRTWLTGLPEGYMGLWRIRLS